MKTTDLDAVFISATGKIIEVLLDHGLTPKQEDHEFAKLILIRVMWSLLAENGQVKPEVLKKHFDDYRAALCALAIPVHELIQAALLPSTSGTN